jgi:hypothetical protein
MLSPTSASIRRYDPDQVKRVRSYPSQPDDRPAPLAELKSTFLAISKYHFTTAKSKVIPNKELIVVVLI